VPLIFDFAYLMLALVTAPWWLRKKRAGWSERFGKIASLPQPPAGRKRLLIHAVSVGEVNAVRALIPRLARDLDVVLAATTDTGLKRAQELFGSTPAGESGGGAEHAPVIHVVRYPLDASWAVRRFLDAVSPDCAALVELEVWPNFIAECQRRGIPVAVINGRLSARSFRNYRRGRWLMGRFFRKLAFVAAQDEACAERFRAMGVSPDRCIAAGNMKWDSAGTPPAPEQVEALAKQLGIDRSRPLIVAGSTAPGEHELLHEAAPRGAQLLCAPRKPEWFDQAAQALPGCIRRSRNGSSGGGDRFLLDSIGELRQAYALADIVVIGRSFGDLFGSDPMEPAALGKPMLIGPAHADFRQAVDALRDAGALLVVDREQLASTLADLLADGPRRAMMGQRALACVAANRGATDRNARMLLDLVLARS